MPCLFLRGVPEGTVFRPVASQLLYQKIAAAVGLDITEVEVHIESTQYRILKPNGTMVPAPDVHIFVEWTGRPFQVKAQVAAAINWFLKSHNLDSDLTFRDSGPGTFFVNGVLIGQPPQDAEFTSGQRVRLIAVSPAFGSERELSNIVKYLTPDGAKDLQARFENSLEQSGISIGSEGMVLETFFDGYVEVVFEFKGGNDTINFHIPTGLLETVKE